MTSIRQGIPHLFADMSKSGKRYDLSENQVCDLIDHEHNVIWLNNITEKTDGQTFMMGWDTDGFWTKNSGSGDWKMRLGYDYVIRATERNNNLQVAESFCKFHDSLLSNSRLMCWLKSQSIPAIRGEVFNLNLCTHDEHRDRVKFVNTWYDRKLFGSDGAFIVHSQLSENSSLDTATLKTLGDGSIFFDDDIPVFEPLAVDVGDAVERLTELQGFKCLNREQQLSIIKFELHSRVSIAIKEAKIKPKWGDETEGWVVHPGPDNPSAPRFKMISDSFRRAKANGRQR